MRAFAREAEEAKTPIMRLAVDTIASSDPSTAARNHPARPLWCFSPWDWNVRFFMLDLCHSATRNAAP
jgi:hypothetical protein